MSISVYESLHYKLEAGSIEPDAEIVDSVVDNKMIEVESDISLSEVGEMVNLYDKRDLTAEALHDNMEPYVGMEFESEEAAMMYYDAYANRAGFIIRLGSCHRSSRDGSVINRRLLCNKEGFRVNKKVKRLEVRKPREVTREGCKAMIMIRKEISGKWIVAKVETEHTHPLGLPPRKVRHGSIPIQTQDDKDKRIRELSAELQHTKRQLTECQKQLDSVLKHIELHVDHLTRNIQEIVQNVKEVEDENQEQLQH